MDSKSLDKKIKELQRQLALNLIYTALKFNTAAYNTLVFETGLTWIRNNMSLNDEQIVTVIAECRLFWAWWTTQWALRDERFIYEASLTKQEMPLQGETLTIALELYYELHNARNLHVIPNRFVLGEIKTALSRFAAIEIENLKKVIYGK